LGIDAEGLLQGGDRIVKVAQHASQLQRQQNLIFGVLRLQADRHPEFLDRCLGLVVAA
jgi:hypothetical protein